jgi:transposase
VLRRVWARHFARNEGSTGGGASGGVRLRVVQGRGPGDRIASPYDTEARFRAKSGTSWTGYMAHITETCDAGAPRLVVHADTTPANVHEAMRTEPIHAALADKGLAPAEHLVDAGYISAGHLVAARERFGIDLIGPPREDMSWQTRTEGAFGTADFTIDWGQQRAQCPEGHMSANWGEYADKTRGRYIRIGFSPGDCDVCPSKARCTKTEGRGRQLTLHTREEHEALAAARARLEGKAGRKLYAPSARASRARLRKRPAHSACDGRATAGWPRHTCRTWQRLRRPILTALEHGSPIAHLPPHASRASPRLPRSERLRQRCLFDVWETTKSTVAKT